MSKPLFFTGRKEIANSDVQIRLRETGGDATRFRARIELSRYSLVGDAVVIVEAYHNTYLQRFQVGTVGALETDRDYELKGLEVGDRPLFRVKVIGSNANAGRLLAAIDKINALTDDDAGGMGSLLPLIAKSREEMGDEFWRVNFTSADEPEPELWINREVNGLYAALQNQDPKLTALIMPEILRRILCGLVENGVPWTEEGRLGQWLTFAKQFYPEEYEEWDEEDEDDEASKEAARRKRRDWVNEVVKSFAALHRLFDRYHDQLQTMSIEENNE
jgi:hypothetical protein